MYTTKTPTYTINLKKPESERWLQVIAKEKQVARRVARRAITDIEEYTPRAILKPAGWILKMLYSLYGGRYSGEIETWAD